MAVERVLSGMRPTGSLHLGHYHGVLKNWVRLQHEHECLFFVADWHALTTHYDTPEVIEESVWEMVIDWLAAGVDPATATIFIQSRVPEHAELHTLLSMITPLSWLERVPTYKDQQEKLASKDLSTYGFLGYPLLQSADILIYKATQVPVGEDQIPHIEFTREIARRFNHLYGREAGFEAMLPPERSADPAVRLVREMVASRVSPPDRRAEARAALLKMLESRPPAWTEAWIRAAVGRSLLMESDRESRLLGIAQLAHIPARLSRESPYLTGVAIAEMAVAVAELGDAEGGVVLRQELASGYGGHPALEWAPLRALAAPPARATAPKADSADSNADPITGEGGPN